MRNLLRFQFVYWNLPKLAFLTIGLITSGFAFTFMIMVANGNASADIILFFLLVGFTFTGMTTKDTFQWTLKNGVARETFGRAMVVWHLVATALSATVLLFPLLYVTRFLGSSGISIGFLFIALVAWFLWQHSIAMCFDIILSRTLNLPFIVGVIIGLALVFGFFILAGTALSPVFTNRFFISTLLGQNVTQNVLIYVAVFLLASFFNLAFIRYHYGYSEWKEMTSA